MYLLVFNDSPVLWSHDTRVNYTVVKQDVRVVTMGTLPQELHTVRSVVK